MLAHELGHFKTAPRASASWPVRAEPGRLGAARLPGAMAWFYRLRLAQPGRRHDARAAAVPVRGAGLHLLRDAARRWWSRKHEFEADEFAAKFASARELAEAAQAVSRQRDDADAGPPALRFYDSHPPALVRICTAPATRARHERRPRSRRARVIESFGRRVMVETAGRCLPAELFEASTCVCGDEVTIRRPSRSSGDVAKVVTVAPRRRRLHAPTVADAPSRSPNLSLWP